MGLALESRLREHRVPLRETAAHRIVRHGGSPRVRVQSPRRGLPQQVVGREDTREVRVEQVEALAELTHRADDRRDRHLAADPLLLGEPQRAPQRPQCAAPSSDASQPLLGSPSQSAKPAPHVAPHTPATHVAVALARTGHALSQRPQCARLAPTSTHAPPHSTAPPSQPTSAASMASSASSAASSMSAVSPHVERIRRERGVLRVAHVDERGVHDLARRAARKPSLATARCGAAATGACGASASSPTSDAQGGGSCVQRGRGPRPGVGSSQ